MIHNSGLRAMFSLKMVASIVHTSEKGPMRRSSVHPEISSVNVVVDALQVNSLGVSLCGEES